MNEYIDASGRARAARRKPQQGEVGAGAAVAGRQAAGAAAAAATTPLTSADTGVRTLCCAVVALAISLCVTNICLITCPQPPVPVDHLRTLAQPCGSACADRPY